MSVTVAVEGNRRKGDTSLAEIEQCILDIKSWFQRVDSKTDISGLSSSNIQKLEKTIDVELPKAHKFLLSEMDGTVYVYDKQLMSSSMIIETVESLADNNKYTKHKDSIIPLAGDDSSMLVIYIGSKDNSNRIMEWDVDDGLGDEVDHGSSLGMFLEAYRDFLLSGQCEYISGVGVIEKVSSSSRKK